MQRKELTLIIVFAIFSAIFSYFISGVLLSTPEDRKADVEVVDVISADLPALPTEYFNSDSVNPTQEIVIEPGNNENPFGNGSQ